MNKELTARQRSWEWTPLRGAQQAYRGRLFRITGCYASLTAVGYQIGLSSRDLETLNRIQKKLIKLNAQIFRNAQEIYGKQKQPRSRSRK